MAIKINGTKVAGSVKLDTTLAQPNIAAEAKAVGDAIKNITPADIGAVNKAGDTMTDHLTLEKTGGIALYLNEKTTGNTGQYVLQQGGAALLSATLGGELRGISFRNSGDTANDFRYHEGSNNYNILHTGNLTDYVANVNPNILDNWYFGNPVDQRGGYVVTPGQLLYSVADLTVGADPSDGYYQVISHNDREAHIKVNDVDRWAYFPNCVRGYTGAVFTIDRWALTNSNGSIRLDNLGMHITGNTGDTNLVQYIQDYAQYAGKTMTMSCIADGKLYQRTFTIPKSLPTSATSYGYIETPNGGLWTRGSTANMYVQIRGKSGLTQNYFACKLELGTQQTLAHQDANGNWVLNEIPDYNEQLLRCCMNTAYSSDTYANNKITANAINATPDIVTYYSETTSADDLLVPLALIPISTSSNAELQAIIGGSFAYVHTIFYGSKTATARRMQLAFSYNSMPQKMAIRNYGASGWAAWNRIADANYAVPLDGSKVMTGSLTVSKSSPYLYLKNTDTTRTARMASTSDNYLSLYNEATSDASNNRTALWLAPETSSLTNLFSINHIVNGTANTYKVLHTGNLDLIPTNRGTAIPASADLDAYQTPGYYYVASKAIAESITNTPFTNGGYNFIVQQGYGGTGHLYQFAITSHPRIYWRQRSGNAWGSWRSVIDSSGGTMDGNLTVNGTITGTKVVGAIWNDYAEYRISNITEPGRVICENGDDTLSLAIERLQPGANVISDTFGFAIGETDNAKTPIAVSGRVLAYPYEDRHSYNPGDAVCAGPGGTVSKMSREEIMTYPERIIGTVSAIPEYETWGTGNVEVNGRIWIKIK